MSDPLERKLAVILHTDVVGSTKLVQKNEAIAHQRMVDAFRNFEKCIEASSGKVHEIRGDALLATFPRGSDAVNASLDFQQQHGTAIALIDDDVLVKLRVGIAMGEVIIADGTITGAGVVLAQRLEQICEPGHVVIQGAVYETLPKNLPLTFYNLGDQALKGFDETVRAFQVSSGDDPVPSTGRNDSTSLQKTTVSEKPSVAVLPFNNQSGDPEQEYFSDGISEDIIAELSSFHALFVIARNSSFRFKNSNLSIQAIGRELGVQYIVEGSVRRSGNRVRIIAQLIETETESPIWAERFDRNLEDIFDVQDEVTQCVVAVLPGRVQDDVVDRAARKPTENMKAYELMLQGKAYRDLLSAEGNAAARDCCEKAIALDPRYARAYMYLSDSYIVDVWLGLAGDEEKALAMQYARKAAELDSNDVYIQDHLGFAHLCCGLWREAEVQFDKTLSKIVNEAESMAWCGYAFMLIGKLDKARSVVTEAIRLDPLHPPTLDWILAQIAFFEGQFEEVVDLLYGKALLNSLSCAFVAAAHAYLGNEASKQTALEAFITERKNEFNSRNMNVEQETIETLAGAYHIMWKDDAYWQKLVEGLRLAGLKDN